MRGDSITLGYHTPIPYTAIAFAGRHPEVFEHDGRLSVYPKPHLFLSIIDLSCKSSGQLASRLPQSSTMHQHPRPPPAMASPATSEQTNPTRTNNPRDKEWENQGSGSGEDFSSPRQNMALPNPSAEITRLNQVIQVSMLFLIIYLQ